MRLFRRKDKSDAEPAQCPYCREPLPDGATKCMMCGSSLPIGSTPQQEEAASIDEVVRPGS
jgi:hypothetical protein